MIALIGPGGSGKTTCGRLLAEELGTAFVDLDEQFLENVGHIGDFISTHGYPAYARANLNLCRSILDKLEEQAVISLSSGFMCYDPCMDPVYPAIRDRLIASEQTYCLLASHDRSRCIEETVRRQMTRLYLETTPQRQTEIISRRFHLYGELPVKHVANNTDPRDAVARILSDLRKEQPLRPSPLADFAS